MSSTDLRIEVTEQPEGKTPLPDSPVKPQQPGSKPSKLPSWLQSKRNKVLAGLGLLTLIAVPCIVGPSVAAAQAKQRQRNATIDNVKRDPTAGELRFTDDRSGRTTSFDASRFAGNDTLGNSTLKVPRRTRQASTKPERWSPFIKIKDGQVCGGLVGCTGASRAAAPPAAAASSREAPTQRTLALGARGVRRGGDPE
jgi:hypothetical protein